MHYDLTDDYIAEARQRAYRFQGQWTGTSGALAADVARLLIERKRMQGTITGIQETNAQLRAAVEARLAGDCCGGGKCQPEPEPAATIPVDWILQGQKEMDASTDDIRWTGDSILAKQDDIRPGTTAKFGTGAVRSSDVEEFRYDLVSPIGLREVARACAEGAEKYGDWNWEKGMPVHDLLNHVLAHIYQFLGGDRSEPHLGHAAWGILAAIHSHELWPELNAGTLRTKGCKAPSDPV
jgi:hypothetical protein